jgi:ubiquitin carboxyl-terminal hydrolase 7
MLMLIKFMKQFANHSFFASSRPQKEPFSQVKERIQKKAEIPDKEFEKYKIGIVTSPGRVQYLDDDQEYFVNREDFNAHGSGEFSADLIPDPVLIITV